MRPGSEPRRYVCSFCCKQLYGNHTLLKKHIVGPNCTPSTQVERRMLELLVLRTHEVDSARLSRELDAIDPVPEPSAKRSRVDRSSGSASRAGALNSYVSTLIHKESQAIDVKCARWIYRRALPLQTTENDDFKGYSRALNPAYSPPTRFDLARHLLENEYAATAKMLDVFMQRSKGDGDILIGGDGWSNKRRNSIYNVVLFTPEPLYVETKV